MTVEVEVDDRMQRGYRYALVAPEGRGFDEGFRPELTPAEMLALGVFGGKYMTDCRGEFPAAWFQGARLSPEGKDIGLNYFGVDASQPLSVWRAKGWDDFQLARNRWGAPPLNLVYADVRGEIGWSAAGRTPVRPNWDGLMPVPGDGRYEWQGFLRLDELPSVFNPKTGYFATANQMNLPQGYPIEQRRIGFAHGRRRIAPRRADEAGGHALLILEQRLQEMFRSNPLMVHADGDGLGGLKEALRAVCELFEIHA